MDVDPDEQSPMRLYWKQFDDNVQAKLTAAFHAYRHVRAQEWFDAQRHPGKSQKVTDTHHTVFPTLTTQNISARLPCPKRPVRAVVLFQGFKRSIIKYGSVPPRDNEIGIWWQYLGDSGWQNFSYHFVWQLNDLCMQDPDIKTEMIETYIDRYLNQKKTQTWTMDLQKMEGTYRGITHKIRVMQITPIFQLGEATPINNEENSTETTSGQGGKAAPSQNDSRGGCAGCAPAYGRGEGVRSQQDERRKLVRASDTST